MEHERDHASEGRQGGGVEPVVPNASGLERRQQFNAGAVKLHEPPPAELEGFLLKLNQLKAVR
jgi:hypothetical protein